MNKEFLEYLNSQKTEENTSLIESIKENFGTLVEQDILPPEQTSNGVSRGSDFAIQLINGLNGDLEREYMAGIQYIQHASVMTGAEYVAIITELLVHADEEFAHAKQISDRINYLGGIPTAQMTPAKLSNNPVEMLKQDKAGEDEAIARYKERIQQAETARDFGTKQMLMGILLEEEEHRNDLINFLGE